jgi:hypothetical protein
MKFTQHLEKTQAEKFLDKFPNNIKNAKSYIMKSRDGKITSVETEDKDIIDYVKSLGITE